MEGNGLWGGEIGVLGFEGADEGLLLLVFIVYVHYYAIYIYYTFLFMVGN